MLVYGHTIGKGEVGSSILLGSTNKISALAAPLHEENSGTVDERDVNPSLRAAHQRHSSVEYPHHIRGSKPMPAIKIITCEDFIADAARPLFKVCDELVDFPLINKKVIKARRHIKKAMIILDEAYADLR
jgi:hypothetical protein